MFKLVCTQEIPKPEWIENMGSFNTIPTPNRESTETDFQTHMTCRSPLYLEYRQVHLKNYKGEQVFCTVHIFWFHDVGYMMVHPTQDTPTRYFRLGCHHKWTGLTEKQMEDLKIEPLGPCEHIEICNKCGTIRRTDSSD